MEIAKLIVQLIGFIAWPLVACVIGWRLIVELQNGLVGKIVQPGGTIEYGGAKFTIAKIEASLAEDGIPLETPSFARIESDVHIEGADNLSPYDIVMTAWGELARTVNDIAVSHDGYDDLRQVWSNIEILRDKSIVSQKIFESVRSLQAVRNGIRRTGVANSSDAQSYAQSAFSLSKQLKALT
jgi:hypothetical protein